MYQGFRLNPGKRRSKMIMFRSLLNTFEVVIFFETAGAEVKIDLSIKSLIYIVMTIISLMA